MLTVVTGPPCSGKTTYVQQHALPGDIIIDFDHLAQALGSPVTHEHDTQYRRVAAEARHAAIGEAIACHHEGCRVWVVDASPGEGWLRQYRAAHARIVTLTADPAELHRRAQGRTQAAHTRIDHWLGEHTQSQPSVQARTSW
jgi:broad-specificity NMP kinase